MIGVMRSMGLGRRVRWVAAFAVAAVLLAALAWFPLGPYRGEEPVPEGIVDMHCHVAGIGAGGSGCFVCDELRASWKFGVFLRGFGITEKELEAGGDRIVPDRISKMLAGSRYVRKAVILAIDGVAAPDGTLDRGRTQLYVPNEFVADAAARHPNLLFGASVNPYLRDSLERLDWAAAHGAVLVKWIPSIMDIDPADPELEPFYRRLAALDLPLLTHGGKERALAASRDEYCDPEKLRLPLSLGVRVIVAHVASTGRHGGEADMRRLARMMREYPDLFADISSLTQLNKRFYLRKALTWPEFDGRLVYGTDFPLIRTAIVSPWYFVPRLTAGQMMSISRIRNPWDADVELKQALGTPADVFARFPGWLLRFENKHSEKEVR